jgi:hypothetical protein
MTDKVETHGLDDLVERCLDKGMSTDDTAKEIAEVIDALIPLEVLGPAGKILEALDGPAILAIVKFIQKCRGTPEQREARRRKREERRAARKAALEAAKAAKAAGE